MAEYPRGVFASPDVPGIVNLGCQLGNKLAIYTLGVKTPHFDIRYLVDDVSLSATLLRQLWESLNADKNDTLPVYTDAGRKDVEDLATRCGKTYVTIIRSVYRASLAAKVVEGVSFETLGVEDLKAARLCAIQANMDWDLVEDAIETSQKQLSWLLTSITLHMQVFDIARLQIKSPRAPGSFDEELASRALGSRILTHRVKCAEKLVKIAEEKAKRAEEADAASVASVHSDGAASWKSGVTAKDSRPPSVSGGKIEDEKDKVIPVVEIPPPPPGFPAAAAAPPPPPGVMPPGVIKLNAPAPPPVEPIDVKLLTPKRRFPAKVFVGMAEWVQGLFGRGLPPLDHLELEATILHSGINGHHNIKAPILAFEPKTLLRQLKRVLRRVGDAPGDQLLGLDSQFRFAVQNAPERAQKKDGRARSLIAVDTRGLPEFIVAYMSIEAAMEPVQLTDALGRKLVLPYEQCRTLKGARTCIHNRFRDVGRMWPIVRDGAFEIVTEDGSIITPEAWEAAVKPGAVLKMRLSAFNDGIPAGTRPRPGLDVHLTWAEPYVPPMPMPGMRPGHAWARPGMPMPMPGGPPPPVGMPPGWGGAAPPPPPGWAVPPEIINVTTAKKKCSGSVMSWMAGKTLPSKQKVEDERELGFEPDFGPDLTREKDLDEEACKNLGRVVALWTNATDTEFNTDSGTMPWYDDAASVRSASTGSSSSSEEIVDD